MPVKDYIPEEIHYYFFFIAFKESRGWIFRGSNAQSFSQWYKSKLSYKPDTDPNHKSMAERKGEKDKYAGKIGTVRLFYAQNHYEVVLK